MPNDNWSFYIIIYLDIFEYPILDSIPVLVVRSTVLLTILFRWQ